MIERFGKYEILNKIAAGGFGEVYRGFDPVIKRNVAIKTCSSNDETTRRRFELEAEISGNLHHRNIVTIYDFGVQDDVPYLVQELLTGEDLDDKIKRGEPIPYADRMLYLQQIARGLGYAHSKGVIHRDVKPGNIHILKDGTVKVMDFGIAQLQHQQTGLTATGQTIGTTAYLSPEQVKGEAVDHRTDIFSFGALTYELVSFQRAFQGDTFSAVMYQILSENPRPIREHWPECPNGLVRLIDRCLEKERDGRFADFGEIVEELKRLRGMQPQAPIPHTSDAGGPPSEPSIRSRPAPTTGPGTAVFGAGRLRRVAALVGALIVAAGLMAVWMGRDRLAAFAEEWMADQPVSVPEPPPPEPPPAAPVKVTYRIDSNPPGARVVVDGTPLAEPTPTVFELEPQRRYDLRIALDGFEEQGKSFMLTDLTDEQRTARELFFPLKPRVVPGRLVARAGYPLSVEVDGRTFPPRREHDIALAPGTYTVRLRAPEVFYAAVRRIEVDSGEPVRLSAPATASINIAAQPSNCRIRIDGRDLGFAPVARDIAYGPHDFAFEWVNPARTIEFTEEIGPDSSDIFRVAPLE